ncbi:MAG: carbon storage regulator [Planctomycetota bacterium]|jgi:carbon storage regulator CsrA|uniref:carbon storage regulator n=1 Tax=uncultured Gimesia sp. TaxID=1678688 RepID=UPI00263259E8|nr:carbon storage regulator [uncultured Gimesia sp.]
MLVLTRKKDEQIRIADDIVLTVVRIQGGKVKLGIECSRKIPIRRNEIPLEALDESDTVLAGSFDRQDQFIL